MADQSSSTGEKQNEATAEDGKPAPFSGPLSKLPIVVVPGIMGTRLSDGEGRLSPLVWNPRGQAVVRAPGAPLDPGWSLPMVSGQDPDPLFADGARLQNLNPLTPHTTHGWDPSDPRDVRAKKIVNFYNLVGDSYGKLLFGLAEDLAANLRGYHLEPRVYACGYEWRLDCALSAARLSAVVDGALANCEAKQVILIAHSMGGLVSRYYCKKHGESKVRAFFLIASPSLGAPEPYFWLKEGIPLSSPANAVMRLDLIGALSQRDSCKILRKFPASYQLLPSIAYSRENAGWLDFTATLTGRGGGMKFSDTSSPALYTDPYTGLCETAEESNANRPLITSAADFHAVLTEADGTIYMPKNTWAIVADDVMTGTGVEVVPDLSVGFETRATLHQTAEGDGSVPIVSSAPPKAAQGKFQEIKKLPGAKHRGDASRRQVRNVRD